MLFPSASTLACESVRLLFFGAEAGRPTLNDEAFNAITKIIAATNSNNASNVKSTVSFTVSGYFCFPGAGIRCMWFGAAFFLAAATSKPSVSVSRQ
jgi:hypothetical protein